MPVSKKRLKRDMRELLDRKPDYVQRGRLTNHLMIELGYDTGKNNNGTQIKAAIGECLDELEAEGIVTLVKTGKVYHEVHRTKRQRAIRGSKTTQTTAHESPRIQLEEESTAPMVQPTETPAAAAKEEPTEKPTSRGIDIVLEAVEAAERHKQQYDDEVAAHTRTKETMAGLQSRLSTEQGLRQQAEAKASEADAAHVTASEDAARYKEALRVANKTIEELNATITSLSSSLEEAKSRSDIDELALRLEALRQ